MVDKPQEQSEPIREEKETEAKWQFSETDLKSLRDQLEQMNIRLTGLEKTPATIPEPGPIPTPAESAELVISQAEAVLSEPEKSASKRKRLRHLNLKRT